MARVRFSIILPLHVWNEYRQRSLLRAIRSIEKQTFAGTKELIIVNDGSTMAFDFPKLPWIKLINQEHLERVNALSAGLQAAQGEIICLLDSDDEFGPSYLKKVHSWFKNYPEYKMFNFGAKFIHSDGAVTKRDAFKPQKLEVGHEIFGGGNIVNGTFVFSREIYDKLGAYPKQHIKVPTYIPELNYTTGGQLSMSSPYDFSAAAQLEYPEIRPYFSVDVENEPNKVIKELGNPWGNDYFLFYKYTRKYHSKPIDQHLYIVHLKGGIE